jgi:hypothetical protein
MFSNEKNSKKLIEYLCEKCDFSACNKNDYNRHLVTKKHIFNENQCFSIEKTQKNSFACECGKTYKDNSGLWRHKKKCLETDKPNDKANDKTNNLDEKELIMMLIKQNTELLEIVKNGTHNTTNNTNNSHNKTFNLNMFLNETCKNAMNINDFVDSLQLQISDLEKVGEVGYIEGISSIIIKNLNAMDITKRPIHCTDKKRETMYIRDEDKWEKEDEKKAKLHKMVKNVAYKNINLISDFQELHPDWKKINSKYSDQINKIIIESMGGKGDNEYEKEEKIIKRVAKEVFVDKVL